MNKEIKELFNKYEVKDLKDKNGQSECFNCKNIKHRYSLTWTSFLYEYKEDYYCFECLLTILSQQENKELHNKLDKAIEYINKNKYFYSGLQNEDMEIGLFEDEIDKLLEILKDSDVD